MLRRLEEDHPGLGPVTAIEAGLSDPHDGGRTVHILHFEGGRRLVYKPRSLAPEAAFSRLLAWCNERGLSLELRGARVMDRGSYGWMDFVAQEPCADEAAVGRFHRRAGMLLGLLHAFGSRDCHYENLVAQGEHPVLIDLEAWLPVRLRKWLPGEGLGEAWYRAAARLEGSVLSTGFLPRWQEGPRRGELHAVGGLGGGHPETRLERVDRVWREVRREAQPNVPVLDGRPVEPWRYRDEVAAGFSEMYALLLRHRAELLAPSGPLRGLEGLKTRLVLRSTAVYHRLLGRSLEPLARVYREGAPMPLLEAEIRALEQADIPRFLVPVAGTAIEVPGGGTVEGALEATSLEAVRARLEGLGEEDLRMQVGFIHAALAPPLREENTDGHGPTWTDTEGADGMAPSRLLEAAGGIAARLRDLAIRAEDGSAAWIGPRFLKAEEAYELAVLGPDLYGGTAGVALFLAAFSHVTGDRASRDLALQAIAPLREPAWRDRTGLGIGGMTGIASVAYAFAWIGTLLEEEEGLIAEALGLTALLTPERIAADRNLDVLSGGAGVILALLALGGAAPGPNPAGRTALEIADECAAHILAHPSPRLKGFAHGPAGAGHALLRLAERTGRGDLRAAALPLLDDPGEASRGTWCRGTPGIALARLGALDASGALAATRSYSLSPIDHLCCGNLGRAEVLLEASRVLGDPELLSAARGIAGRVLARAGRSGRFGCTPFGSPELTDPTLFRGEAGIGLALLRLAGHGGLPCVLKLAGLRA
ncbi:MAG: type 2 lanthipeptide synthetase LanM [Thermoanaerobaculia bacterium]